MKALQNFVAQKNHWNSFFKGTQYSLNTAKDRQALADMIDSALSPENLTCDGEVRGVEQRQKAAYLNRCVEELFSIDPTLTSLEY